MRARGDAAPSGSTPLGVGGGQAASAATLGTMDARRAIETCSFKLISFWISYVLYVVLKVNQPRSYQQGLTRVVIAPANPVFETCSFKGKCRVNI